MTAPAPCAAAVASTTTPLLDLLLATLAVDLETAYREGLAAGKGLAIRGSHVPATDPWLTSQTRRALLADAGQPKEGE